MDVPVLIDALRNIRDYRTDVDASVAAPSMRFYAELALEGIPGHVVTFASQLSKLTRYAEYGNESGGGIQECADGDFISLSELTKLLQQQGLL